MSEELYENLQARIKQTGPREKMLEHGATVLKDNELLAIIFGTGYGSENVLELSARVLADYGNKALLKAKNVGDVMETAGLPKVKSCQLLATLELGRRFFGKDYKDFPTIRSPEDAYKIFKPMENYKKETLEAIYLNPRNKVIHKDVISIGTVDETFMDPAEIFEPAVACRALGVIIAHNHPSGNTKPSEHDLENTKRLQKAGEILKRPLIDHLIIGKGNFYSIIHN